MSYWYWWGRGSNLGPFLIIYEVGMGVYCSTLMLYLRKAEYAGHLKWDSARNHPTSWSNIYERGNGRIWRTIFEKYEIKELPTNFNTRGPRSVRLHKGKEFKNGYGKETLFWNIGVDTGGNSKKLVSIIEILGKARQGKVAEVMAAVLIGLCWGLRG